ncbi:MAG: ATP-binding cassette domain-containing protein [Phycisphaerae bacterium]
MSPHKSSSPSDSTAGHAGCNHSGNTANLTAEAAVEFDGVDFTYDGPPVIEGVTFSIRRREFVCLIGPNGGGKTTLLKLMLGLLQPGRGVVRMCGVSPSAARARIGYMPQHAALDPHFPVTALDVVLMGRLGRGRGFGPYSAADRRAAEDALRCVNLQGVRRRSFSALSGGQRQRVLIARALACEPELLLLDEPTANVDPRAQDELYGLFRALNERLTLILVSHDVGFVSQYVHRVLCVNRSVVAHDAARITGEAIRDIYGHDVHMVQHGQDHAHS